MDILAIRGKTISAVICQLLWREFGRKFKIECCDKIFNFFLGKSIDQSIALQVTKVPKGEDPSAEVPRRGEVRA